MVSTIVNLKILMLLNCFFNLFQKLPDLTSLNLARCQHLTDITLKSIKKHSKKLRNINMSMVRNFTEACVLDFIISLPGLEQVDMYDVRISTEGRETLAEIGKHRKLKIILYEFHSEEAAQKNPSEMLPNFGQVWYWRQVPRGCHILMLWGFVCRWDWSRQSYFADHSQLPSR